MPEGKGQLGEAELAELARAYNEAKEALMKVSADSPIVPGDLLDQAAFLESQARKAGLLGPGEGIFQQPQSGE